MKSLSIDRIFSNKIQVDGQLFDFFSGTSYLSLNTDEDFQRLLIEGMYRYGASFGSSRNGNFQLDIYEKAEIFLAKKIGAEKSLTVSSGMLAGQLLVNYFYGEQPAYLYAPQTHAANFHLPNISPPKISFVEWVEALNEQIDKQTAAHIIIVCNSCDALKVSKYDFSWTKKLPKNKRLTLIIDDSHGIGIMGNDGSGIYQQIEVATNVDLIVIASLHKAFGMAGGVIVGKGDFIDDLRLNNPFFSSCSPMAPANLYALLHAEDLYLRKLDQLRQNIRLFISSLSNKAIFSFQEDYPVFYTSLASLYEYLLRYEIFIYHFAYPIQTGIPNTRIVLNASHKPEQIYKLANIINDY